jgi:flagellar biosynthesis/type III secretory pathway chaperone
MAKIRAALGDDKNDPEKKKLQKDLDELLAQAKSLIGDGSLGTDRLKEIAEQKKKLLERIRARKTKLAENGEDSEDDEELNALLLEAKNLIDDQSRE